MLVKGLSAETSGNRKQGLLCDCIVPLLSSSVISLHSLTEGPGPEGTIHASPPIIRRPVNFPGILNCALQALSRWEAELLIRGGGLSLTLVPLFLQPFRL